MKKDFIDDLQDDWSEQKPEVDLEPMGVVLRIQALAKILGDQAAARLQAFDLHWWQYDALSTLRRQRFSGRPVVADWQRMKSSGPCSASPMGSAAFW